MSNLHSVDRSCIYKGVQYNVVQVLDHDFLLCASKEDMDNCTFPLPTVIIPDEETKQRRQEM